MFNKIFHAVLMAIAIVLMTVLVVVNPGNLIEPQEPGIYVLAFGAYLGMYLVLGIMIHEILTYKKK